MPILCVPIVLVAIACDGVMILLWATSALALLRDGIMQFQAPCTVTRTLLKLENMIYALVAYESNEGKFLSIL